MFKVDGAVANGVSSLAHTLTVVPESASQVNWNQRAYKNKEKGSTAHDDGGPLSQHYISWSLAAVQTDSHWSARHTGTIKLLIEP